MSNRQFISKIKDYAELAMSSYGYFHLVGKKFANKEEYKDRKDTEITMHDILDFTYKGYVTSDHTILINPEELGGDFGKIQTKRFFERYDILIHQPNTDSGFSATLFKDLGEIDRQTGKRKTIDKDSQYILAIRGTELNNALQIWADLLIADLRHLLLSSTPKAQYEDMLLFYYQCIGKIPLYVDSISIPNDKDSLEYKLWKKIYQRSTESKYKPYIAESLLKDSSSPPILSNFTPPIDSTTKLIITGHSLGGCLAQFFALSFATDTYSSIINGLYTYNAPGARTITPPYDYILKLYTFHNEAQKERFIKEETQNIAKRARELGKDDISLENKIQQTLQQLLTKRESQYYGITMSIFNTDIMTILDIKATPLLADIAQRYETLAYNYTQHFKEDRNTPQNFTLQTDKRYTYKLAIHNAIYHCESSENPYKNEWYLGSPISKLGIKLGLHKDNQYTDTTLLHTINTGSGITGSHSITPLTQTLYLYSYLLELDANYNKVKDKSLSECIEYLNAFMQSIFIVFNPLSIMINNKNLTPYRTQEKRPNNTDFLATFIESILYVTSLEKEIESIYITLHTTKENIIDKIIILDTAGYFPRMIDKDDLYKLKDNKCTLAEKRAIFKCQPFVIVNRKDKEVLDNQEKITKLFKYNSNSSKIILSNDETNQQYFNARIAMMDNILYGDEVKVCYIADMKQWD